jgi:hypothetical protein
MHANVVARQRPGKDIARCNIMVLCRRIREARGARFTEKKVSLSVCQVERLRQRPIMKRVAGLRMRLLSLSAIPSFARHHTQAINSLSVDTAEQRL